MPDLINIFSQLSERDLSYGLIFLVGVLASFHCVGMCGGLVVTYAARTDSDRANDTKKNKLVPNLQYNAGRFISYIVIGAVLGGFGSFFGVNPVFTGAITILAGFFMLVMGLSLFNHFKFLRAIQPKTPKFIARYLFSQKDDPRSKKGPLIIGLLNGFMPCGPLQAMQIFALGTGSALSGGLAMGIFALGTIPLMFGFGSLLSFFGREKMHKFYKFSGVLVAVLGLLMVNRGLVNFGLGYKQLIPQKQPGIAEEKNEQSEQAQLAAMDLTYRGYVPNVLYLKKGVPVKWVINVKEMSGCTDEILLHGYNISKKLNYGENIIEFTPKETGEIRFSCWMKMVWGKFIVN